MALFLAFSIAACSSHNSIGSQPSTAPTLPATTPIQPTPPPIVVQNDGEIYQQALDKADAAAAIGQSAPSKDDLFLAAQRLEQSVQMLKSIAPTSSQYILAIKVLPKYERQLAAARQKAASFVSKPPSAHPVISTPAIAASQLDSFSIPIEQKLGGVPVINVALNGNTVPMLLDTGASHSLITPSIAARLQVRSSGNSQAKTANGTATFKVAAIDSVKFGAGEQKNVLVAIGQKDLPYGLLGHDVYDGYDITIKENSIEFRKR